MWIFEHNFVADKAKIRRQAVARQVFFTQYATKFAEKTRVYACEDRFLNLCLTLAALAIVPAVARILRVAVTGGAVLSAAFSAAIAAAASAAVPFFIVPNRNRLAVDLAVLHGIDDKIRLGDRHFYRRILVVNVDLAEQIGRASCRERV